MENSRGVLYKIMLAFDFTSLYKAILNYAICILYVIDGLNHETMLYVTLRLKASRALISSEV